MTDGLEGGGSAFAQGSHAGIGGHCQMFCLIKGADITLLDTQARTPLMRARENGSQRLIHLLKAYGAGSE